MLTVVKSKGNFIVRIIPISGEEVYTSHEIKPYVIMNFSYPYLAILKEQSEILCVDITQSLVYYHQLGSPAILATSTNQVSKEPRFHFLMDVGKFFARGYFEFVNKKFFTLFFDAAVIRKRHIDSKI